VSGWWFIWIVRWCTDLQTLNSWLYFVYLTIRLLLLSYMYYSYISFWGSVQLISSRNLIHSLEQNVTFYPKKSCHYKCFPLAHRTTHIGILNKNQLICYVKIFPPYRRETFFGTFNYLAETVAVIIVTQFHVSVKTITLFIKLFSLAIGIYWVKYFGSSKSHRT
jgi:hypothetical protein